MPPKTVVVEDEPARRFAGMLPQHVVFDRVAGHIEHDAVDGVADQRRQVRRANLVGLDEAHRE